MIEPIESVPEMGQINMSSLRCACRGLDIRLGSDKRRESRVKDKAPTVCWILVVAAIDGLRLPMGFYYLCNLGFHWWPSSQQA